MEEIRDGRTRHAVNDSVDDDHGEQFGDEIDLLIDEGEIKNSPSKIFIFDNDEIKQIR